MEKTCHLANLSVVSRNKRKSYLILPDFQWKIVLYAAGLAAGIIAVLYLANFFFFASLREDGLAAGLDPQHPFFSFLEKQTHLLDLIFIGVALAVNAIVILGGLWLSNRIAGPIYRIEQTLSQLVKNENPEKLSFRSRDFFTSTLTLVNELVEKQRSQRKGPSDNS